MSPSAWLHQVHLTLFYWLRDNAAQVLPQETAETCARAAMARTVTQALYGYETLDGVHAYALGVLQYMIRLNTPSDGEDLLATILSDLRLPDGQEVCDVSRAYSMVYMTAHHAGLSIQDRSQIVALIEQINPPGYDSPPLVTIMERYGEPLAPLRRAFWVTEGHKCDGDLICATADQLRDYEERKGLRWLQKHSEQEVMSGWRA